MPEDWNPFEDDDEEDEYTPAAPRNAAKRKDNEEREEKSQMKKVKVDQPVTESNSSSFPLVKVSQGIMLFM